MLPAAPGAESNSTPRGPAAASASAGLARGVRHHGGRRRGRAGGGDDGRLSPPRLGVDPFRPPCQGFQHAGERASNARAGGSSRGWLRKPNERGR